MKVKHRTTGVTEVHWVTAHEELIVNLRIGRLQRV